MKKVLTLTCGTWATVNMLVAFATGQRDPFAITVVGVGGILGGLLLISFFYYNHISHCKKILKKYGKQKVPHLEYCRKLSHPRTIRFKDDPFTFFQMMKSTIGKFDHSSIAIDHHNGTIEAEIGDGKMTMAKRIFASVDIPTGGTATQHAAQIWVSPKSKMKLFDNGDCLETIEMICSYFEQDGYDVLTDQEGPSRKS